MMYDVYRWNKYCLVSQDYRKIPTEFLIDKCETGYHDFISLHIKVCICVCITCEVQWRN
jgi:hypothetical protein